MRTTNIGLYLEDNDATTFMNWRKKINGVGTGPDESNMTIIDREFGKRAYLSQSISKVLYENDWFGDAVPYTQDLAIDGLIATQNGSITLAENATLEQIHTASIAGLFVSSQKDGTLTVGAKKAKPSIDIPVTITLLG